MNFSKLMEQADDTIHHTIQPTSQRSPQSRSMVGSSYYTVNDISPNDLFMDSFTSSTHSTTTTANNNNIQSNNKSAIRSSNQSNSISNLTNTQQMKNRTRNITVNQTTPNSFMVSLPISYQTTIQQVMDVISNPNLLHEWCQPISAICMAEHKGGSSLDSLSTNGTNGTNGTPRVSSPTQYWDGENGDEFHKYHQVGSYQSPSLINENTCSDGSSGGENGGDVIIRSAEEEEALHRASLNTSREEHDGEWIQVTTTGALNPPPSHYSNPLTTCVVNSRALLGFPCNGNVTMFVERNRNQVGMTIGPFKGGTMLSHTMTVNQVYTNGGEGEESRSHSTIVDGSSSASMISPSYIELVDHVKVYSNGEVGSGGGGDISCFCFNEIQHLIQEWTVPDIEGYIDQTVMSLEQLRDYVECGGERNVHRYTMQ